MLIKISLQFLSYSPDKVNYLFWGSSTAALFIIYLVDKMRGASAEEAFGSPLVLGASVIGLSRAGSENSVMSCASLPVPFRRRTLELHCSIRQGLWGCRSGDVLASAC